MDNLLRLNIVIFVTHSLAEKFSGSFRGASLFTPVKACCSVVRKKCPYLRRERHFLSVCEIEFSRSRKDIGASPPVMVKLLRLRLPFLLLPYGLPPEYAFLQQHCESRCCFPPGTNPGGFVLPGVSLELV